MYLHFSHFNGIHNSQLQFVCNASYRNKMGILFQQLTRYAAVFPSIKAALSKLQQTIEGPGESVLRDYLVNQTVARACIKNSLQQESAFSLSYMLILLMGGQLVVYTIHTFSCSFVLVSISGFIRQNNVNRLCNMSLMGSFLKHPEILFIKLIH